MYGFTYIRPKHFFYELDEEKENSFEIFREVLEYRLNNGNMLKSILIFHSIFLTCDENNFIQNGNCRKHTFSSIQISFLNPTYDKNLDRKCLTFRHDRILGKVFHS